MKETIAGVIAFLKEVHIESELIGDGLTEIVGFSDPSEYREHTIIWLGNAGLFNDSICPRRDVSLLLIKKGEEEHYSDFKNLLLIDDPRNAFNRLVEHYFPINNPVGIEDSAVIAQDAVIGDKCYIGHNSCIESNVIIGDNTVIQNNVTVRAGASIGSNCFIGDSTSIGNAGFGFRITDQHEMYRLPHLGSVCIGNRVEIGSNVCICRGTFKNTKISDGVKIDSNTYIGHNVSIDINSLIINSQIDGNSSIGSGSTIINSDVTNRVQIGSNVFVGIGSVVVSDIPDNVRVFGVPARVVAQNGNSKETKYIIEKKQLAEEERNIEQHQIDMDQQKRNDLFSEVVQTITIALNLKTGDIETNTAMNDVEEWDSLAQLKIIVALENKFHVEIPIDRAVELTSIEKIAEYLSN